MAVSRMAMIALVVMARMVMIALVLEVVETVVARWWSHSHNNTQFLPFSVRVEA